MVALVNIEEANGTGPNPTHTKVDGMHLNDGTDVRFCTADAVAPVINHPCIIPGAGFNYSYWKHLFLAIKNDTYTKINNVRFCTAGGIGWACGTGGGLFVANMAVASDGEGCPMDGSYVQSSGTQGSTGFEMIVTHNYYAGGSAVDAATYTAGSPIDIDLTDHLGVVVDCKAVVLQVKLAPDSTQGQQSDEVLMFIYDEI